MVYIASNMWRLPVICNDRDRGNFAGVATSSCINLTGLRGSCGLRGRLAAASEAVKEAAKTPLPGGKTTLSDPTRTKPLFASFPFATKLIKETRRDPGGLYKGAMDPEGALRNPGSVCQ